MGTTNDDGSPHAVPVWGVVVGDTLYLCGERATTKAKNLARDGRAIIHLERADNVVIVHGHLDDLGRPSVRPDVVEALSTKYHRAEDR